MARILLTGGRAPAALELARVFHNTGHTVYMAESLRGHLSQPSNAIKKNYLVPPPRQQFAAFIEALKNIVVENRINLLIPTCDEVFYVAMGRDQLPCVVFAEPIKKLNDLYSKWNFVINAIGHGLYVPETMLIHNQDDLLHAFSQWRQLVIKPVYSRFAAQTLLLPTLKQALATLKFDSKSSWIAQEYIKGTQICSYSVCLNGRITAHTAYPSTITAGQGAAIVFKHINHPAIFKWVKAFVEKNNLTGQIAIDFIETSEGQLYGMECNPRATNGVHLLASHPNLAEAFLNPYILSVTPARNHSFMLINTMLLNGFPEAFRKKRLGKWFSAFFTSKDVVFDKNDLRPFLLQLRTVLAYWKISLEKKITPLEAATVDIEWNGEQLEI